MQLRILGLGLLKDGNVGVGIFPQRQEILICRFGFRGVALQHVGAGETDMDQCADGFKPKPRWSRIFWNSAADVYVDSLNELVPMTAKP